MMLCEKVDRVALIAQMVVTPLTQLNFELCSFFELLCCYNFLVVRQVIALFAHQGEDDAKKLASY